MAGSGRQLYQTIVRRLGDEGSDWVGRCSCPVSVDCKHAAAVVLAAQERLGAAGGDGTPGWEAALAPLVRSVASAPTTGRPPAQLGLEVGVRRGLPSRGESLVVLLRPLRQGRSGRWVRTGVRWRDLSSPWASPDVEPAQRAVLAQLHAAAQGPSSYHLYGSADLPLGEAGPLVWHLLRRCADVGVELVAGDGVGSVALAGAEVEVVIDLARGDDGGLTLAPRLVPVVDDEGDEPVVVPTASSLHLVGRPPHGLASLGHDGHLVLHPLRTMLTDAVVPLVERGEPVRVPPEDVERFLTLYYPGISRQLGLSSVDGSVPGVERSRPRLRLEVTPEAGHVLRLAWSFRYSVPSATGGTVSATVPLERGPQDPPRDHAAEDEAVAGAVPLLHSLPALVDDRGRTPRPYPRTRLTGHRTARFVAAVLPRLEASEHVEVQVLGDLATYGEAAEAPVVTLETSEGEAQDWFDLHVTVTVDGQAVPFEELFAALARGDEVMLLDSGTWFPLDAPELHQLRRLIDEARELDDRTGPEGTVRLTPYQAGLWEELVRLGVPGRQSERWQRSVDSLLALGDADRGTVAAPEGLEAQLRPYQLEGYRWLSALWDAGLGGVLADDMGLGKTLQALATVVRGEARGDLAEGPVLVVAPTTVVATWAEEAQRFAPGLRVATVTATQRRRGTDLATAVGGADLVVTSYTLLRLEAEHYRALPWAALFLDEAQFVKNHRSATYQAVRRVGAVRSFVITGTPLENSLMDLWSMLSLAAPGLFPRPETFTQRYRRPIEAGGAPEELDRLRRRVRPFMLRRTKAEVATELPAKTEQTLHVELHPAHRRVYDRHLNRERQRVLGLLQDMDKNRMAIFRALTALRQLALDPALVSEEHVGLATSAKVAALVQQLQELASEGHRALVFSSFTGFLALVRAALEHAGLTYSYLDGRTRDRAARVAAFREGDDPVFLISLKAGGFGLTLTEADYVFVLDPWWNPAAEAQAVDRTHRIGQTRPVNVYRMVSTGTIEEKVVALQERKRQLFATVVDSGELGSGTITAEDIRGLLAD
ncbi:DEAD/DEAH box helicase [Ornithinimicrobium pekingense]|uniref:DNA helicase n=1 Tax=Ornithinimicrobium pekingense TaxID=384677 RepID=A0ABQ2F7T0_9MICO|nr:DEAD/DEAH box helicase [Ornithinimicrobium pekingense]GGK69739.1 DNA helicase [Ornithinimicrobium pekingense]